MMMITVMKDTGYGSGYK